MASSKGKSAPAAPVVTTAPAVFDHSSFQVIEKNVTRTVVNVAIILHRIHKVAYGGDQFNPGIDGNARFSPIKDAKGKPIPTIYAGETFECAAMESVFHDVPYQPGLKTFDKMKLVDQVYSTVETIQPLTLADLSAKSLRKLGIPRNVLIDTEKDQYPFTRTVAEAIYAKCTNVQGLQWTSRQDDNAQAYVFFGDRINPPAIRHTGVSKGLVSDPSTYDAVLDLADKIGANIVP